MTGSCDNTCLLTRGNQSIISNEQERYSMLIYFMSACISLLNQLKGCHDTWYECYAVTDYIILILYNSLSSVLPTVVIGL
jgi:hypothetical protein